MPVYETYFRCNDCKSAQVSCGFCCVVGLFGSILTVPLGIFKDDVVTDDHEDRYSQYLRRFLSQLEEGERTRDFPVLSRQTTSLVCRGGRLFSLLGECRRRFKTRGRVKKELAIA